MRKRATTISVLTLAMVAAFSPAALAGTGEQFTAPFSGDQVVPGPGDPDGAGGVHVSVGTKTGTLCFFSDTANISTPITSMDLHQGARGEVGRVVAVLHGFSNDPDTSGCLNVGRDQARDISKNRAGYYIDIHNQEFPEGAVRAQLG